MENEKNKTSLLKKLGPGLITGAADDDPSGIATYSQAGTQFGFNMLWTVLFTFPFMAAIQLISARIGRVTGHGLATNIRKHYSPILLFFMVGLLLIANTINIAADISAMGEASTLILGGNREIYAVTFGITSLLLQIFIPYRSYVRFLKWLTLALLTYVATVFSVKIPWTNVLEGTLWPSITWRADYITTMVAVFGTTISPYLFFWQASQEVEEQLIRPHEKPLIIAPEQAQSHLKRIKWDTIVGMAFSNVVAFFIILTAAVALHLNGVTDIKTSADAAAALRPLAGDFAFFLFSAGIVGTGLLAIPVLAGSSAYALAETFGWNNSLECKPQEAKRFYAIIALSTLGGIILGYLEMDAIKALYWSAVINGVISIPIMVVMILMASRRDLMGRFVINRALKILGWLTAIIMAAASIAMFVLD